MNDEPRCLACAHRQVLHGDQVVRGGTWCIAWNGERFCGCTVARAYV